MAIEGYEMQIVDHSGRSQETVCRVAMGEIESMGASRNLKVDGSLPQDPLMHRFLKPLLEGEG